MSGPIFLISFWNSLKLNNNNEIFYKHYFSYETGKFVSFIINANLSEVNLTGVFLGNANLFGADLTNSELIAADLAGCDFSESNLENTYLNHADLSGANLNSAKNLTRDQVETAFINKETILPDSISLIWVSNTEYEFE